jgi:2-dehydro-3-deoxyphosphogluconate aldolase/(4S)-4-hydroxy-2-oxoglutarate aldolase
MTAIPSQADKQARLAAVLARAPVVPVVTIDDAHDALPLARALAAGGIGAIEITLRTAAGIDALRAIAQGLPDVAVGAGTVLDAAQVEAAIAAGATFLVSPGVAPALLDAVEHASVPWLPGIATAGEAMTLMERGYRHFKFFPAAASGGAKWLAGVRAPLADARFCPTGGVNAANAAEFLALPDVVCVGGSWVAPRKLIATHAWGEIERLARAAVKLRAP